MSIGLVTGPLQMLFSLLLMQGLSLTMFRTFLNQAIPRLDPMRFSLNLGNDQSLKSSTPAPAANLDAQNILPYLNLLAPMVMQQQMNRQQNLNNLMQPIVANLQPSPQPQVVSAPLMTAPSSYQLQAPVYQAFQVPAQNGQPQMIILPQVMPPTQSSGKGSASTNFPVQVEPPLENQEQNYNMPPSITKRMLNRPPTTTTRQPKVDKRAHAGAIHVQFATPRAPAGFRRVVIPAVTAQVLPDYEVTPDPNSYEEVSTDVNYFVGQSSNDVTESSESEKKAASDSPPEDAIDLTTTSLGNKKEYHSVDALDNIQTTNPSPVITSEMASTQKTTGVSDNETIDDKNLLNHKLNDTKDTNNSTENMRSINGLIHKDFDEYVKNISLNQIDSNQSQDIYFENSKGVLNQSDSDQFIDNFI